MRFATITSAVALVGCATMVIVACDDVDAASSSSSSLTVPAARSVLLLEETGPPVVSTLDLATFALTTRFQAPSRSFIYEMAIVADAEAEASDVVYAWSPPPDFDRSFLAVEQAGVITRVAGDDVAGVWAFYPAAAARQLWWVEVDDEVSIAPIMVGTDRTTGEVLCRRPWATEPALSPDGARVVWVGIDAETGARSLELGDSSGAVVKTLVPAGGADIGLPFFSADGRRVFYVGLSAQIAKSWGETLTGLVIGTAYAHGSHDVAGDWWVVDVDTDEAPRQLTHLASVHYDGVSDPGGDWLFVAARDGVYQVNASTGASILLRAGRDFRAVAVVAP